LDEIVAVGRESDDEARQGRPPLSPDLLEHAVPTTLTTDHRELVADVDTASSVLRAR